MKKIDKIKTEISDILKNYIYNRYQITPDYLGKNRIKRPREYVAFHEAIFMLLKSEDTSHEISILFDFIIRNYKQDKSFSDCHNFVESEPIVILYNALTTQICNFLYEKSISSYYLNNDGKLNKIDADYWFSEEASKTLATGYYRHLICLNLGEGENTYENYPAIININEIETLLKKKKKNVKTSIDENLPEHIKTLIDLIIRATKENDLTENSPLSKINIKDWLKENWIRQDGFCNYSDKVSDSLATLIRHTKLQDGGHKKT